MDEIIDVNAGGQVFTVKRSTLLMAPEDSLLNAMFSGRWNNESLARDAEGRIFLDMSPPVFAAILSKLRAMTVSNDPERINNLTAIPIEKVYEDELLSICNYYGLFPNLQHVFLQVKAADSGIKMANERDGINLQSALSGKSGHRDVIGVEQLGHGAAWKVTVVTYEKWFSAGITAKKDPAHFSCNDPTCFSWFSRLNGLDRCQEGDVLVFKLDNEGMALKMYHSREKKIYRMPFKEIQPWRLYFNFHGNQTIVKLSKADPDDLFPILDDK